jgi:hypothetical protein
MNRNHRPTQCERTRDLLARRVDETLKSADERFLNEHLGGCAECRSVASWIGEVDALSARAPLPEVSEAELSKIEAAVMDEIRSPASAHTPRRATQRASRPRRSWLVPSAAAAAAVAFLSWWQLGHGPDPLAPPDPAAVERQLVLRENVESPKSGEDQVESDVPRSEAIPEEAMARDDAPAEEHAAKPSGKRIDAAAEKQESKLTSSFADAIADADVGEPTSSAGRGTFDTVEGLASDSPEHAPAAPITQAFEAEDEATLNLRRALSDAKNRPTVQNLTQLMDLWEQPVATGLLKDMRPLSVGANEPQRAQTPPEGRKRKQDADLSPSFEDSLRSFLASIADEEEHAPLRIRILRLLEELPPRRE